MATLNNADVGNKPTKHVERTPSRFERKLLQGEVALPEAFPAEDNNSKAKDSPVRLLSIKQLSDSGNNLDYYKMENGVSGESVPAEPQPQEPVSLPDDAGCGATPFPEEDDTAAAPDTAAEDGDAGQNQQDSLTETPNEEEQQYPPPPGWQEEEQQIEFIDNSDMDNQQTREEAPEEFPPEPVVDGVAPRFADDEPQVTTSRITETTEDSLQETTPEGVKHEKEVVTTRIIEKKESIFASTIADGEPFPDIPYRETTTEHIRSETTSDRKVSSETEQLEQSSTVVEVKDTEVLKDPDNVTETVLSEKTTTVTRSDGDTTWTESKTESTSVVETLPTEEAAPEIEQGEPVFDEPVAESKEESPPRSRSSSTGSKEGDKPVEEELDAPTIQVQVESAPKSEDAHEVEEEEDPDEEDGEPKEVEEDAITAEHIEKKTPEVKEEKPKSPKKKLFSFFKRSHKDKEGSPKKKKVPTATLR